MTNTREKEEIYIPKATSYISASPAFIITVSILCVAVKIIDENTYIFFYLSIGSHFDFDLV